VEVSVDPDFWEADTLCVAEAPKVFDPSDDEVVESSFRNRRPKMESAVTDAVFASPRRALRIISD
jgi:ferredoxin